jgi:PAS domain S-box-containing protein
MLVDVTLVTPETEERLRRDEIDTDGLRFTGRLGIWESNLQTGFVEWNREIDDILGLPREGPKSGLDRMLVTVVPEEREEVAAALQSSVNHKIEHQQVEYRCLRPDGREVWVRNEWSLHCDEEGRPAVLRGVIQDITYRRKTKAALRRRTELLELLYAVTARANTAATLEQALETSLEHICTFGGWQVGSAYRVSKHEPRELVPTPVWYAAEPGRYRALHQAVQRTRYGLGSGKPGIVLRTGRPLWSADLGEHSSTPATLEARAEGLQAALDLPVLVAGETVAVMEFFSDDTHAPDDELMQALTHVAAQIGQVFERQRADEALRESEARLRQILESMPMGVYVMDATGTPYFANRYAITMRGQGDASGPLQGPHGVYIAGTDQPYPRDRDPIQRALAGERSMVADLEFRPRTGDGRRIPLECWGSPVFDETGRVAYALCAFYDISERRKIERMKDEFVSVVSHELRTPLTSIQGAIGLLENGVLGALPEEALEMTRIAGDSSRRLLRLVNELLDIQKLESEAPTLHPRPLALGPVLEQAVTASRPHAAALHIRVDLEDEAPGARVLADADRLSQVVANLLSNAMKYTPPGERVRVVAARRSGKIRVAVEDRGPGVPEEFRGSLFQKFCQADASDARQKSGTGLGLAICKVIVEKLGGRIAHEPIAEGGARFYFELPELTEAP